MESEGDGGLGRIGRAEEALGRIARRSRRWREMESVDWEGTLPQGLREIEVGGDDTRAGVGRERMCGNCCMMGWN